MPHSPARVSFSVRLTLWFLHRPMEIRPRVYPAEPAPNLSYRFLRYYRVAECPNFRDLDLNNVAEGNASLEHLRRFSVAKYWYMRGGVKHFALSILNSPDLETQRFFHERLSGELEYLSRFRPFMEAVGLTDSEVARQSPPPGALNAVNYLVRLSVEGGAAEKAVAWYLVGRVFSDTCSAMREGLAQHYRLSGEALKFFDIPHVRSERFVDAVARLMTIYGLDRGIKDELEQVAAHILANEEDFYDSMV